MSQPIPAEVVEVECGKDKEFFQPRTNEFSQKFIAELVEEKERLGEEFPLCALLIEEAIDCIYSSGRIPGKEFYADVLKQKPLKVTQKVFVPVKQYPTFNFTGKILGPKGNSLRRLQEETKCKIAIKGRNSMRNSEKEEELRNSGDWKFAHFNKDLYLEISTVATPAESYARVAYALAEIRKHIIPDMNDEFSQDQLREMMELNPEKSKQNAKTHIYKSVLDRRMPSSNGTSKYVDLIKKTAYQPQMEEVMYEQEPEAEEEVTYEYPKQYIVKRPPTFEYTKVRPNMTPVKRAQPTMYATEIKRPREVPTTQYKPSPNPYAPFKKYR